MYVIGAVSRLAPMLSKGVKMSKIQGKKRISLSRLARAAHADAAAVATSVSMLVDAAGEMTIDDELLAQIIGGIRAKVASSMVYLQAIDDHLASKLK